MRIHLCLLVLCLSGCPVCLPAQTAEREQISSRYVEEIADKAAFLERRLDQQSSRILESFFKQEGKLLRRLARKDSAAAASALDNSRQRYEQLQQKLAGTGKINQYIPSLDSLGTSLKFLEQYPQLLAITKDGPAKLKEAMDKVNGL